MEEPPGSAAKTICSICFDDLRPVVEDLLAIPVCGHVFHTHCLQQWFEYCPKTKKHSCPVCKQTCAANKVCRLYFQSFGDGTDASPRGLVVRGRDEDDPTMLKKEVHRLEAKVGGLTSVVDQQGKDLKVLNSELQFLREQVKKETSLKEDAFKQKMTIQQLLHMKSQELDKTALECLSLQERNMALAKELAALKLVADLDLEEDEILKLSCLGNESNSKDTIDVLRKSLVIRNKSYKELMAKCNTLGRGEARSSKKLDKMQEKISKLKLRVQELETAIEAKDNQALRALKDSMGSAPAIKATFFPESIAKRNFLGDKQKSSQPLPDLGLFGDAMKDADVPLGKENVDAVRNGFSGTYKMPNGHVDLSSAQISSAGKGTLARPIQTQNIPNDGSVKAKPTGHVDLSSAQISSAGKGTLARPIQKQIIPNDGSVNAKPTISDRFSILSHEEIADTVPKASMLKELGNEKNVSRENDATDDDLIILNDIMREKPMLNIRKEAPIPLPLCKPGDICVSGGLLGPDGTPRYLGKWCKRGQNKTIAGMNSSNISNGDLIAVGSDGRGGRVKALRSTILSPIDDQEKSAKRCKSSSKPAFPPSQGSLQIEHFFGKISN
ncbi:hypothetical protein MLD38_039026 [Melastoma candidum]|uniref:Uncharacterized protein n=1 Tax=Melastoma candidum TaxID=119954 RepID=A0ACB9L0S2_9MYRT|nr:hypothetical protein MLD38_039026 [Melastoma candidum]